MLLHLGSFITFRPSTGRHHSSRSFVFGQSRAKVSACFTNVRSLAVAAFDLLYCSLSVLRFVFVLYISKQSS